MNHGVLVKCLLCAVVTAVVAGCAGGPQLRDFEYLLDPRVTAIEEQKVIQVTATGDPNEAGSKAFGMLYDVYYRLDGTPKGPRQPAPRARWPEPYETSPSDWVGLYAMPVPDSIVDLPPYQSEPGMVVELVTWEYGAVAEILHVGSYDTERPTIERLHRFISDQGYEISGAHEEEYLKGPGMWGVAEKDYLTVIRYQVRKP